MNEAFNQLASHHPTFLALFCLCGLALMILSIVAWTVCDAVRLYMRWKEWRRPK